MAQLVARLSGGQEAVSSSLATPTKKATKRKFGGFFFFLFRLELKPFHIKLTVFFFVLVLQLTDYA